MAQEHIPQSAIESAVHAENQAAAKEPQGKGFFEALYDIFREAVTSIRHETDVMFWGRDTLPRQNETHHHGTVDVSDKGLTFDQLMAEQASLLPPVEDTPQQQQSPGIDR